MPRVPTPVVALGLIVAVVAVVGWWGALALGPAAGPDAAEHIRYAEHYDATGSLPGKSDNYEYASPPAFAVTSVYLQRAARAVGLPDGAPLPFLPPWLARLGLLALLAVLGGALASGRAGPRARTAAAAGVLACVALAVVAALAHARAVPWSSGQLVSLLSACGLVVVSWALARRAFPGRAWPPLAVAAATAALPIVLREAVVFHPELLFAFLVAAAVLAFADGVERGYAPRLSAAAGVLLGLAAVTRQSAAIVAVALGASGLLLGRARALRFVAAGAVALALVAGPWWGYQASRFGNPIQSNLDRPGYMLPDGQPASFYVSLPLRDLVVHPYRDRFANQLLPKFHADLWSDWYGVDRGYWASPTTADRVLASSQSVLGFGGDLLVLAGVAGIGLPALAAARRGRDARPVVVTLTTLFVLAWAAFVATLVRFPQRGGDPIKSSYLLFVAPAALVLGVGFAERLWRRGTAWRAALAAWAALLLVSYSAVLATTY